MTISEFLKDKKRRNRTILSLLIVIFPIIVYLQFFKKEKIQEGAERAVYCTSCKAMGAKIIVDIDDDKDQRNYCKICGGRLRYAAKCLICDYEFPLPPANLPPPPEAKKTMGKFRFLRDRELCPNCKHEPPDTIIMSSDQIKNKSDL